MSSSRSRRILRLPAVTAKTGVCPDTIYRWARNGQFPKPIKLNRSGRASGWFEDEVEAFLATRAAERDATLTTAVQA
jgi:prophage regulatory protein